MTAFKILELEKNRLINLGLKTPLTNFFAQYNISSLQESNQQFLSGNLSLLSSALEEKIGYRLILQTKLCSSSDHAELISKKIIPFATESDHDLIVHIFPILSTTKNIKTLFDKISKIESPICRSNLFEIISTTFLLRINPYLTPPEKNHQKWAKSLIRTLTPFSSEFGEDLSEHSSNKKIIKEYRQFLTATINYLLSDESDFTYDMTFSTNEPNFHAPKQITKLEFLSTSAVKVPLQDHDAILFKNNLGHFEFKFVSLNDPNREFTFKKFLDESSIREFLIKIGVKKSILKTALQLTPAKYS